MIQILCGARQLRPILIAESVQWQAEFSCFVCDVGVIAGQGWAVVEANPAYGSGIYGCDAVQVLKVVRKAFVN